MNTIAALDIEGRCHGKCVVVDVIDEVLSNVEFEAAGIGVIVLNLCPGCDGKCQHGLINGLPRHN